MKRLILAFGLLALSGCACEDRPGAEGALRGLGFTKVQLREPAFFFTGCSDSEKANHPFTAVNSVGQTVSGVVCCGGPLSTKGCTVRF